MNDSQFIAYLEQLHLARNSIRAYCYSVDLFFKHFKKVSSHNLLAYKELLIHDYKPQTVNLRLQGMNRYLAFIKADKLRLRLVKLQSKNYLENVITQEDYLYFKRCLHKDGFDDCYFLVWFLGATGARISELLQLKVEHVENGLFDIYSKGGKIRRVYIPSALKRKALKWLYDKNLYSGFVFLNSRGKKISARGVALRLKKFAFRYGLDPKVVYPHSFRHRFAKNFLQRHNDIALLADLLGHTSVETTRIYLRQSTDEHIRMIDKIINW